jgi:hypothetical protein
MPNKIPKVVLANGRAYYIDIHSDVRALFDSGLLDQSLSAGCKDVEAAITSVFNAEKGERVSFDLFVPDLEALNGIFADYISTSATTLETTGKPS